MARTRGAELNVDAVLGRGVSACLGATYVDARYLDFQNAPWNFPIVHGTCPGGSSAQGYIAGLCTPIAGDASGHRMVQAPPWRVTGGLGYAVDTVLGKLSADTNAAYTSKFYWDSDNFLPQKSYVLVNASLTLVPAVARNTFVRPFYYKYNNIQVNTTVTGGVVESNAATASIKGIDVDLKAIPARNLTLTAALEFLDARYDNYTNGVLSTYSPGCAPGQSNCQTEADLSGYKMPHAAPFSASLVANYLYPTSIGHFNLNVTYNHGGNYYFDPDNGRGQSDPSLDKQRILNLVNTSLRWTSNNERYDVTLWGKNITDQRYLSIVGELTVATTWGPAPPATYGITFGVHLL